MAGPSARPVAPRGPRLARSPASARLLGRGLAPSPRWAPCAASGPASGCLRCWAVGWALWAGVGLGEGLCCTRQRGCTGGTLRLMNVIYCGGFGSSAFPSFPSVSADSLCPPCRRTSGQLPDAPIHSDGAGLAVGSASSLARGCGACKRGGHRWMLPSVAMARAWRWLSPLCWHPRVASARVARWRWGQRGGGSVR